MPAARLTPNVRATPPPAESLAPAASALPGSAALKLDAALSLLSQSGHEPLAGEAGSAAWMQGLIDALCELSSRDALTGLANRRHFEMVLAREIDRVARAGEPALLLMLDIDHFKRVNDSHGHAAGDLVLKAVSEALLECVRPMDTVARIGGEEFAIVLPNCPPAFGPTVAERVRTRVERRPVAIGPSEKVSVTVSLGGAFAPQWVRSTVRLWLERADLQLYNAKTSGRNRAVFEPAAVSFVTAEEKGLLFSTSQFDEHDGEDPKDGHA
jgi:diguanylate cyclase (GGDEF)-like protein